MLPSKWSPRTTVDRIMLRVSWLSFSIIAVLALVLLGDEICIASDRGDSHDADGHDADDHDADGHDADDDDASSGGDASGSFAAAFATKTKRSSAAAQPTATKPAATKPDETNALTECAKTRKGCQFNDMQRFATKEFQKW